MCDASSETQGQLVGAGKSLNWGEKIWAKKSLDFSAPEFFSRPFRPFRPVVCEQDSGSSVTFASYLIYMIVIFFLYCIS